MNIAVCIKQVPASTQVKMDPVTHTLIRDGAGTRVNPHDLHALEAALGLRDRYEGKVTAITMGPPQAAEALRTAVAMTADDGLLVCGREFAGADTLATSYALAQAVKSLGNTDLVVCGKLATDGDTAQVGPGISRWLEMPLACNVTEIIEASEGSITLKRKTADGTETVKMSLPAVITVEKELNIPRIKSIKGRMRANSYEPQTKGGADLGCESERLGLKGSPTSVCRVFVPSREASKNEMIEGNDAAEKAMKLADILRKAQIIL
ncbi:MAG: electron transfer flavoprotein subunit beta/FixA family protein [bacterium]|nr:electron transfer flavoprotein subunit beta/FixA family protein [bacterium]